KYVKGMCLNISNNLVADIVATLQAPDTPVSDPALSDFFYTDRFLENKYDSSHTRLGKKLQMIYRQIHTNSLSNDQINSELFFELAEQLVADQVEVYKQLQSIPTVKSETRRDLCRRVLRGKEYIDSNYTDSLTVEQIARTAG